MMMPSTAEGTNHIRSICKGPPEFVEYVVLPEERLEEAIDVQQDSMRRENLAVGVGIFDSVGSAKVLRELFRMVAKDGCSVAALDTRTDEIVAVCFNKIRVRPENGERDSLEEFVENNMSDEACRALLDFLAEVESKADLFRHYNARCIFELFYVGTDARFGGCGVGLNVMKASIELARQLGQGKLAQGALRDVSSPEVAFGIFTSNFSQRVASRLGFEWLATILYEKYFHRGQTLSERIGEVHKAARLGALRLV